MIHTETETGLLEAEEIKGTNLELNTPGAVVTTPGRATTDVSVLAVPEILSIMPLKKMLIVNHTPFMYFAFPDCHGVDLDLFK